MRFLLPVLFATLAFTACKQDEDDNPTPTADLQIALVGISEVEAEAGATAVTRVPISVISTNSVNESTQLSISGLPTGVTATFQPASGTTPFTSEIRINSQNAGSTGTLPVSVTATAASGVTEDFSFDLTVKPPCLSTLIGSYNVVQNCAVGSNTAYTSAISADASIATRVRISNFYNTGATVFAEVDCASRSFTIPSQAPSGAGFTVDGSGQYTTTTATMYFNITPLGGGISNTCAATYTR